MRRWVGSVLIILAGALVWLASMGSPTAAQPMTMPKAPQEPGFSHTFSVIYWPTGITNFVTLSGNRGAIIDGASFSQPFLIYDYRLATPIGVGLHLYYAPLLSGSVPGVTSGLWGAEATYDWVIHPTPTSQLILDFFAGYSEQNFNPSTPDVLGNPIGLHATTGGVYFGIAPILPLSKQWAFFGAVSSYPWGFANFSESVPAVGLSTNVITSAPQWNYAVGVKYTTEDQWGFTLGYKWAAVNISGFTLPTVADANHTLGGSVCPCNVQVSGFILAVSKSF